MRSITDGKQTRATPGLSKKSGIGGKAGRDPSPGAKLHPKLSRLGSQSNRSLQRVLGTFAGKQTGDAPAILQSKLQVNAPGDAYEQEADRVAERVMRMPQPQLQRAGANRGEPSRQRNPQAPAAGLQLHRVQASDAAGMVAPPAVGDALRSSGQPLDPATRAFMEPRFGHDFGDVRIHRGPQADTAAASVQARAFTVGRDLVFAAGEHAPGSADGRRLLAHELTHVIQQTGGRRLVQRDDAKVKQVTGKDVDTFLDTNVFIKKYIADKVKNGTKVEGHVHIHNSEEFAKELTKYVTGKTNPDTGKVFTEEEIKKKASTVRGFTDGSEIHVHETRGDAGTTIHESIHLFQDDTFATKVGHHAKEGTTEYFTRMIVADQKIDRGQSYAAELKSIQKLVTVTTKETLAAAYFQGKVDDLEKAVEGKGKGTFAKWVSVMNGAKYSDADALL